MKGDAQMIRVVLFLMMSFIFAGQYGYSQDDIPAHPAWWNKKVSMDLIQLPTDTLCCRETLIHSLRKSGLPINEICPKMRLGSDYVLSEDPAGPSETKLVLIPRNKPWRRFDDSIQIPTAGNVISHYAKEVGYHLAFADQQVVLIPEVELSYYENTRCDAFSANGIRIYDIANAYGKDLTSYGDLTFMFMSMGTFTYPYDVRFNFSFQGGNMMQMLCRVAASVNASDPDHVCYWIIGGMPGFRFITFNSFPRDRQGALIGK